MSTLTYRLLLLMAFTLPWENVVDVPGIGRVSKLIGLLVALAWMATIIDRRSVRAPRPVHLFALLFVLWTATSVMWTVDVGATVERSLTYAQLFVLMMVVWETITDAGRVRALLAAYLAGCYVTAASLVVSYITLGGASEVNGRVTVGNFHPNDVGMILALGVPLAVYLIHVIDPGPWRRSLMVATAGYLPLAAFAVLVTGSRAGLAAMLPGAAYLIYLLARRNARAAVMAGLGMCVLSLLALPLAPGQAVARIQGTWAAVLGGDLDERAEVWAEATRLIQDHPLLGVGGGAFEVAAVGVSKVGHNLVLALWAEVGLVGLGLFVAMLVVALRSTSGLGPLLRGLWVSLFSAWLFAAMLHNWEYRKQTWLFIALVVACTAVAQHRDRPTPVVEAGDARRRVP